MGLPWTVAAAGDRNLASSSLLQSPHRWLMRAFGAPGLGTQVPPHVSPLSAYPRSGLGTQAHIRDAPAPRLCIYPSFCQECPPLGPAWLTLLCSLWNNSCQNLLESIPLRLYDVCVYSHNHFQAFICCYLNVSSMRRETSFIHFPHYISRI